MEYFFEAGIKKRMLFYFAVHRVSHSSGTFGTIDLLFGLLPNSFITKPTITKVVYYQIQSGTFNILLVLHLLFLPSLSSRRLDRTCDLSSNKTFQVD